VCAGLYDVFDTIAFSCFKNVALDDIAIPTLQRYGVFDDCIGKWKTRRTYQMLLQGLADFLKLTFHIMTLKKK